MLTNDTARLILCCVSFELSARLRTHLGLLLSMQLEMSQPSSRRRQPRRHATASALGGTVVLSSCFLAALPLAPLTAVLAAPPARSCASSGCLAYSANFDTVFPDYDPPSIGYEYTAGLFRFFLVVICLWVLVWLVRWYMDYRALCELWRGVRSGTVMRIAPDWAAQRNSITRDVLAQWMARVAAPTIVPKQVAQFRVLAHTAMSAAKLQLAPSSIGLLPSPSSAVSPSPSPSPPPGLEYVLKLVVSTEANHACMVEVFLGVEMKHVLQLLGDYDKFKQRHSKAGSSKKSSKHPRSPTGVSAIEMVASPSGGPGRAVNVQPRPSASPEPFSSLAQPPARNAGGRMTVASPEGSPSSPGMIGSPSNVTAGASTGLSFAANRSNRRVTPAPLEIDTQSSRGLPGSAPSPNNSPSHVTADGESRARLSQLSLRERAGAGMGSPNRSARSASHQGHDASRSRLELDGDAAAGTNNSSASPRAPPSAQAQASPLSPPPKGGIATALASLGVEEGSKLFRPSEYLHALPPTIFAPGQKVQASLTFGANLLHTTLRDPARCPMLVFLTPVDGRRAVQLGVSAAGRGALMRGGDDDAVSVEVSNSSASPCGELMIVQFAPPPSASGSSSAAAAAAAAKAQAAQALPPPAISLAAAPPPEEEGKQGPGGGTANDELKEGGNGDDGERKEGSPAPTAEEEEPRSPINTAAQDSTTLRVRFSRQLVLGPSGVLELDEVYGMDESDAECIICLTDMRDTLLLPCKHLSVCSGCFKSLSKCPICRERIGSYMRFTPEDAPDFAVAKAAAAAAKNKEEGKETGDYDA